MKSRTWKKVPDDSAEKVKQALLSRGGKEDLSLKGQSEAWRIRIEGTVFTCYKTGTIYFSGGDTDGVEATLKEVSIILGQQVA